MGTKYEIIDINSVEVTVDVSLLNKTDEFWFNATEIAKSFSKDVREFLRSEPVNRYIEVILNEGNSHIKEKDDLIRSKRGRYGGTWLHNELAFEFAGWCSAVFRRSLHKWVEDRLKKEESWKQKRLEAKTGYLPMTEAILEDHDPAKFYHFSNEADMLNKMVLGCNAKKFKKINEVDDVRDACTAADLKKLSKLQNMNTALINLGMEYKNRKEVLTKYSAGERALLDF